MEASKATCSDTDTNVFILFALFCLKHESLHLLLVLLLGLEHTMEEITTAVGHFDQSLQTQLLVCGLWADIIVDLPFQFDFLDYVLHLHAEMCLPLHSLLVTCREEKSLEAKLADPEEFIGHHQSINEAE